jgi:hypothetical protein
LITLHGLRAAVVLTALVGPSDNKNVPASRAGDFRTSVKRLVSTRDLQADTHTWTIYLEITWKTSMRPLFIHVQPDDLVVKDDRGETIKLISQGMGRVPIMQPQSVEMPIRLTAPMEPWKKIAILKGVYTVIGSAQTVEFTFELDKGRSTEESKDGVTARLQEFKQTNTMWTILIRVVYPPDTPDFESFESWLAGSEVFLEGKDGKPRITPNGGYSVDDSRDKTAILTYRFVEDKNLKLGKPSDWKVVFRTPGKIEKMPVRFEFKDLWAPW